MKKYLVVGNMAAGKLWVDNEYPSSRYISVFAEFDNKEDAERERERMIEESKRWVLFVDNIEGRAFIEEWHADKGAYQERSPYNAMGEFESEQEALEALQEELDWFEEVKA